MQPFTVVSVSKSDHARPYDHWTDVSTADYFIWESLFGTVTLRKRAFYPHTFAYVQNNTLYCGYGDAALARRILEHPLAKVSEQLFYDDEFLLMALDCRDQTVHIQRDAFGSLPLFAGHSRNQLVMSDSFGKVCTLLPQSSLHVDRLTLVESIQGFGQRSNTLFKEIKTLYDRMRLSWDKRYVITQPPDAQAIVVAQHNRTADPKLFVSFLEETLDKYWQRYAGGGRGPLACDMSGGYDSSLIAGYYADKQRAIVTGTLIYPGEFGQSVQQKLQALLLRFPVPNVAVAMDPATEYPLVGMASSDAWAPLYPRATLYDASIGKVADGYAQHGARTVFTGIGGDELCQNIHPAAALDQGPEAYHERQQAALPPFVTSKYQAYAREALLDMSAQNKAIPLLAYSVAQQNIGAYGVYINRGLWPVAPLADPRLFIYCQSLPIRYRTQKNILKTYLHARKFPPLLYDGVAQENFSTFFNMAVSKGLRGPMQTFFASSVLARSGLIDKNVIARMLQAPANDSAWIELYSLFTIEVNLQTLGIENID